MLKKFLFILTFLTTSLFSFQVDMWQEGNNAVLNFNKYYDNVGGDEGTNWVAIYKSGDSNDWDNVITWAWAKDLAHNEAANYDERVFPLVTDEGSYEVRFFLDNSYDVFATYTYSNGGNGNNATLGVADINNNTIIFNNTTADQAWIGIYKKGDSNDWDNVKAWDWATEVSTTIDIANLSSGTYEARLFYNNSYHVETKVEFTKEGNNNNQANISIVNQTANSITFHSTDANEAWIGIYNIYDSNKWENVKAWAFVNGSTTTIDITNLKTQEYQARLFYNNSYDVEARLRIYKYKENHGKEVTRSELIAMIENDEDYSDVDVSKITDMSYLFKNKDVNYDISGWDVSNVTNMSYMFLGSRCNQILGNWDVSNVTDMSYMFRLSHFNRPITNWNVSNVTNMEGMFSFILGFYHSINNWDVSHVINMKSMFAGARFNGLLNWDVSNVINMEEMFSHAYSYTHDLSNWDVQNVIYHKDFAAFSPLLRENRMPHFN